RLAADDELRPTLDGVVDESLHPGEGSWVDEPGELGVRGPGGLRTVAPLDRRANTVEERLPLSFLHEGVVGRDAGLTDVDELAPGDGLRGTLHRRVGRDDRGRLPTELEGHGGERLRRGGHHDLSDAGAPGEEDVIERKLEQGLGNGRLALDHRDLVLAERVGERGAERAIGLRNLLRRLEDDDVARGDRADEGTEGEEQRVVPGR